MFYVYVIKSDVNGDLYIGYSEDVGKRVESHSKGKVKSTKGYKPWELVYYEAYKSKSDATKREYQLKKGYYKEELKKRLIHSVK